MGECTVVLTASKYKTETFTETIKAGETVRKEKLSLKKEEGHLELTLEAETLPLILDISKVIITATKEGAEDVTGSFDESGNAELTLEEGTWSVQIEAEGFAVWNDEIDIQSEEENKKEDIVLEGVTLSQNEIPDRDQLIDLLDNNLPKYYSYEQGDFDRYGNYITDIDHRTLSSIVWQMVFLHDRYPMLDISPKERPNNNYTDNPLGYDIGGPVLVGWYKIKEESVRWAAYNIFNISETEYEKIKEAYDSSEEAHQVIDNSIWGNFYYDEGYYYAGGVGYEDADGFWLKEIEGIERRGKSYIIDTVAEANPMGSNEEVTHRQSYEVEYRTKDGVSFWSYIKQTK